jgi:hypothetical protein
VDHIVIDGQSVNLLAAGVSAAYKTPGHSTISSGVTEYYDFSDAHSRWISENLDHIHSQWKSRVPDGLPYPRVLSRYTSPAPPDGGAKEASLNVPEAAVEELAASARQAGLSSYTALASSFLSAYAGSAGDEKRAVSFLTPVGYRGWPGTESVIGYFTTLGLVTTQVGGWGDGSWKTQLGRDVLDAAANAALPFNLLASVLARPADRGAAGLKGSGLPLGPTFPTWPTLIFYVHSNPFTASSFGGHTEGGNSAEGHDAVLAHLGQPLIGPALVASVTVPKRGACTLSVTFSSDVSEPAVLSLLHAWRGRIMGTR